MSTFLDTKLGSFRRRLVEISKGLPLDKENEEGLTEEQKEQIINAEGKWTVVSYFFVRGRA